MDPKQQISIVIPLHNQGRLVPSLFNGLAAQTFNDFDVVFIDDGSTDDTTEMVEHIKGETPFKFRLIRQEHQGTNVARNRGFCETDSALILYMDGDVEPKPRLVEAHIEAHRTHPDENIAVLGSILQPDDATPMMKFTSTGMWDSLSTEQTLSWRYFFTTNISVKKEFLLNNGGFNEELRRFQDLEFGYRLGKAGLEIVYCSEAAGIHKHYAGFSELLEKTRQYGDALSQLLALHPEMADVLETENILPWERQMAPALETIIFRVCVNRISAVLLSCMGRVAEKPFPYLTAFIFRLLRRHYILSALREIETK
ncbi:glycosyltransferase family 2 protein [Candidatus Hydrogenedentota bacterium]